MRSLASLGPRSVRRDAGRYILTAIGIALGVGVVFGIQHSDSRGGVEATMPAVQRATGKGDVVTSVSIQLGQGVDRSQWIADHAQDLAGVRLVGPNQGLVDLRNLYDAVRSSFAGLAAVAMFVGAFLVFLTLFMAVIQLTRLFV